jgi:hypothetical protein
LSGADAQDLGKHDRVTMTGMHGGGSDGGLPHEL